MLDTERIKRVDYFKQKKSDRRGQKLIYNKVITLCHILKSDLHFLLSFFKYDIWPICCLSLWKVVAEM